MSDLIRVSDEWTKWMNQGNISVPYNAWHVTSVFNNQKDFSFDTVWIGFTNNYEEMGVIQDEWADYTYVTFEGKCTSNGSVCCIF